MLNRQVYSSVQAIQLELLYMIRKWIGFAINLKRRSHCIIWVAPSISNSIYHCLLRLLLFAHVELNGYRIIWYRIGKAIGKWLTSNKNVGTRLKCIHGSRWQPASKLMETRIKAPAIILWGNQQWLSSNMLKVLHINTFASVTSWVQFAIKF